MLSRTWREWVLRWWSTPPQDLELQPLVTPTILVDDVSRLHVPPVVNVWGMRSSRAGSISGFNTITLTQKIRPLAILYISRQLGGTGLECNYKVVDGPPPTLDISSAANTIARLAGPPGATPDAVALRGIISTGTHFGTTVDAPFLETTQTIDLRDGLFGLGLLVLPGQHFIMGHLTANIALDIPEFWWVEIPDRETVLTSIARA